MLTCDFYGPQVVRKQNNSFSFDLVISILLRLPAKSLFRFRCVSKPWLSLITGQRFLSLYLETNKPTQSQSQNSNSLILVAKNSLLTYDFSGAQIVSKLPKSRILLTRYNIIGSANGLICFLHTYSRLTVTVALYNPTTQAHRVLPLLEKQMLGYHPITSEFGFGYDYKSSDFKIVSLIDVHCAHIYRMRTNSWELIRPSDFVFTKRELSRARDRITVFSNNALHWLVSSGILGFNLATEEFNWVPTPEISSWCGDHYFDLADLRGCLHLLVSKNYFNLDYGRSIDIWVMKKYGEKESWTKLLRHKSKEVRKFILSTEPNICFKPRRNAYSKDDQEILLCADGHERYFFSCHLETREVKKLEDLINLLGEKLLEENNNGFSVMPWTCTFATCD